MGLLNADEDAEEVSSELVFYVNGKKVRGYFVCVMRFNLIVICRYLREIRLIIAFISYGCSKGSLVGENFYSL